MKRFILSLFLLLSVLSLSSCDILGAPKPNIGRETGMEAAKFIKKSTGYKMRDIWLLARFEVIRKDELDCLHTVFVHSV